MKKLIAAAAALLLTAGIAGLTACSGSAEASVASTKSGSELTAAGIKLNLPENWTATVGDKDIGIIYCVFKIFVRFQSVCIFGRTDIPVFQIGIVDTSIVEK